MALPVLTASDLRALRSMPKPVPDDWQQMVWPVPNLANPSSQGRLDLHPPDLPSNERMHIYVGSTKDARTVTVAASCTKTQAGTPIG